MIRNLTQTVIFLLAGMITPLAPLQAQLENNTAQGQPTAGSPTEDTQAPVHSLQMETRVTLDGQTGRETIDHPLRFDLYQVESLTPKQITLIREEQKRSGIPFVIWAPEDRNGGNTHSTEVRQLKSLLESHNILVRIRFVDPHLLEPIEQKPEAVYSRKKSSPFSFKRVVKRSFIKPTSQDFMIGSVAGLSTMATSALVWFGFTRGISPSTALIATMIQTGILYSQYLFVRTLDRVYSYNYGLTQPHKRGLRVSAIQNLLRRMTMTFGVTHTVNLFTETMTHAQTVELVLALGGGSAFFQAVRSHALPDHTARNRRASRWAHLNAYLVTARFVVANTAGLTGPKIIDFSFIGFPEIGFHTTPLLITGLYLAQAAIIKYRPQLIEPLLERQHRWLAKAYQHLIGRPLFENPCQALLSYR